MQKVIIFVHPWMWVVDAFEACCLHGYRIISVVTQFETQRIDADWLSEHSDHVIFSSGDAADDAKAISRWLSVENLACAFVVNGLDAAFGFADSLSRYLNNVPVQANNAALFLNKHRLNSHLHSCQIPVITGEEITHISQLSEKQSLFNAMGYPLIAKPSEDTAAMADVKVIKNEEALLNYVSHTIGKNNRYYADRKINSILIQKLIPHTSREYFIDYLSVGAKHILVGCGQYLYDKNRVLRGIDIYSVEQIDALAPALLYLQNVLDASGMINGFTHNEVFITADNEILLVECNPRHCGQPSSTLYKHVYGSHRMAVLLDVLDGYTDGESCQIKFSDQFAGAVHLYNHMTDYPDTLNVDGLPCEHEIISFRGAGQPTVPADFYTDQDRIGQISAIIALYADSVESLAQGRAFLKDRETEGTLFLRQSADGLT